MEEEGWDVVGELVDAFLELESVWEHEQGYVSICSIGEDQRGWIKKGD